ncbi:hypothetical protein OSTOST_12832, partial [Ostertagia ostertagi]
MDTNTDRGQWPLAIVTALKRDPDGEVREATLRTVHRDTTNRSINMLVPLELDDEEGLSQQTKRVVYEEENETANNSANERPSPNEEESVVDDVLHRRPVLPRKAKQN